MVEEIERLSGIKVQCPDCGSYHKINDSVVQALQQEAVDEAFDALKELVFTKWKK